jgi:hypothetical protein
MPRILTASATRDGQPLYRQARGGWTPSLALASVLCDESEAASELDAARDEEATVCDPYLIDVETKGERIVPLSFREQIRATGPTVAIP